MDDAAKIGELDPAKAIEADNEEKSLTCPISGQLFHTPVQLTCPSDKKAGVHIFEKEQILKWALFNRESGCPLCHAPIQSFISRPDIKGKVTAFVAKRSAVGAASDVYAPSEEGAGAQPVGQAPRVYQPRTESKVFWFFVALRALIILAGLAAGIYLSILVVPAIIELLIAAGIAPVFAWSLGIMASLAIIYAVTAASALEFFFFHICWKIYICLKNDMFVDAAIHVVLVLGGLGCGIYVAVEAAPLFIASFATIGIPAGLATFLAVAFAFIFVHLAIEYLSMLIGILPSWNQAVAVFNLLDPYSKWPWVVGGLAGLGLGVYLVILLLPLLTNYFAPLAWGSIITAALCIAIALLTAKLGSMLLAYPITLIELAYFAFLKYRVEASLSSNVVLSPEERAANVAAVEFLKNGKLLIVTRMLIMIDTVFWGVCAIWGMNRASVVPPSPGGGLPNIPEVRPDPLLAEEVRGSPAAPTPVARPEGSEEPIPPLDAAPAAFPASASE